MEPLWGRETLARQGANADERNADERASPKGSEQQKHPRVGTRALLQQRDYVGGPRADAGERYSGPSPRRSPRRSSGCSLRTAAKATRTASTSPLSPPKSSGLGAQGPPRPSPPKPLEQLLARVPCRRVARGWGYAGSCM